MAELIEPASTQAKVLDGAETQKSVEGESSRATISVRIENERPWVEGKMRLFRLSPLVLPPSRLLYSAKTSAPALACR
jgi:hypothetical protein